MAGTFGEPGKNPYNVPGIGGILSNVVDSKTGTTQIYRQDSALNVLVGKPQYISIGTYNTTTGAVTPDKNANLSASEQKALVNAKQQIKDNAIKTAQNGGATNPEQLLSPNTASTDPNNLDLSATQTSLNELATGIKDSKGTRKNPYGDLRYPEKMKDDQDCIIFNMIQYVPTKATLSNISTSKSVFSRSESTNSIGTVTMAIQAPISDMNSVGWNDGNMTALQALGAAAALTTIDSGPKGAGDFTEQLSKMVSGNNKAFQTATKAYFAGQAVQNQELFTRTTGAIANPNLELLFSAPLLREFTFTFLLSPRDEPESIMIKKIIRFFKQGMSVKNSETGVFLKTPHTFRLMYKQKGDDEKGAKFLPKIKECALQNFGVNYTPGQNYATFNNNSMTAYELTMSFKELTPIYDSDYKEVDGNSDEYIGY